MTSPDAPAEGRRQDADGHTVHEESPTQSSSRPGPAAFQAEINHRRQALVGLRAKGTLEDHFGMSSNENIDGRHHHSMSSLMKSDVQYEDYWKYVLTDLQLGKKSRIAVEEGHYAQRSIFCLDNTNGFRGLMIKFVEWPWFDRFILILILLNCFISIAEDKVCACKTPTACTEAEMFKRLLYNRKDCDYYPAVEATLELCDWAFLTCFTLELLCKVAARGFCLHKHSYLWDPNNWLDFVVVVTGIMSKIADSLNDPNLQEIAFFDILRLVRVFRPLRTMTRIPGMKTLILTLGRSFTILSQVVFLLFFFVGIFGILSIDLFAGNLRGRCFVDPNQDFTPAIKSRLESQLYPYLASNTVNEFGWNADVTICTNTVPCDPVVLDGKTYSSTCRSQPFCAYADADGNLKWKRCIRDWMTNPNDMGGGYISYDNILSCFWFLVSHITMEGWSDAMYAVAGNDPTMAWISRIFHTIWVFLGAFFVIQLALAGICFKYFDALEEEKTLRARIALDEEAILQTENIHREHLARRKSSKLERKKSVIVRVAHGWNANRKKLCTTSNLSEGLKKIKGAIAHAFWSIPGATRANTIRKEWTAKSRQACKVVVENDIFSNLVLLAIIVNTFCMAITLHDQAIYETSICQRRCDLDPRLPANVTCIGPLFNRTFDLDENADRVRYTQGKSFCLVDSNPAVSMSVVCSSLLSEEQCYASSANCYWEPQSSRLSPDPGYSPCKLGLYSAKEFGFVGGERALTLRHLCGDEGQTLCAGFDPYTNSVLSNINNALTGVFILEMLMKLFAKGVEDYFNDSWNTFDFVIVLFSIGEFITLALDYGDNSGQFSILRSMRLFRLFKLFRRWKTMRKILSTLGTALRALQLVFCLFLLIAYIFALLMMDRFAGKFKFVKTENPRSNFDLFLPSDLNGGSGGQGSFITVFQIVTTENWTTIMYNCITADDSQLNGFFSLIIVFLGNYVIMNLFISILLSKMESDIEEEEADDEDEVETISRESKALLNFVRSFGKETSTVAPEPQEETDLSSTAKRLNIVLNNADEHNQKESQQTPGTRDNPAHNDTHDSEADQNLVRFDIKDTFLRHIPGLIKDDRDIQKESDIPSNSTPNGEHAQHRHVPHVRIPNHRSLGIFTPSNPVRIFCAWLSHAPLFDKLILLCILISSCTLAIEADTPRLNIHARHCPLEGLDCSGRLPGQLTSSQEDYVCPRSTGEEGFGEVYGPCGSATEAPCCQFKRSQDVLKYMDLVFTIIFVIEMLLKIVAEGLFFGHKFAYLCNYWNILDAFIVAISVVSVSTSFSGSGDSGSATKALKALRTFRVLRPLRVVKRYPQLKTTVLCIISSLPAMLTVAVVLLLYLFVLAMFLKELFMGKFYRCYNPNDQIFYGANIYPLGNLYTADAPLSGPTSVPTIIECAYKTEGLGVWEDALYSFNNLPKAMQTLFEMSTTEGWLQVMASWMDCTGVGVTPLPNNQPWMSFVGFIHILLGSFVLLNLLVSMIINNYQNIKAQIEDGHRPDLSEDQKEWAEIEKLIFELKPPTVAKDPDDPFKRFFFKQVTHWLFELFITVCILANFFCMLCKRHDDDCKTTAMWSWVNFGFNLIFLYEAVAKMIGLGLRSYWAEKWNRTDLAIVFLSSVTIAVDFASGQFFCSANEDDTTNSVPGLGVLRAFRIARVFRLLKSAAPLQMMMNTLICSIPALGNIFSLICLFLVIFSVLHSTLFWNVNPEQELYGGIDDGEYGGNYGSFGNSFFLLFRQTTGETWNSIMMYCSQSDLNLACYETLDEYKNIIGCGKLEFGVIFHILWQFVGTFLMMQLITAVIIEKFLCFVKDQRAIVSKSSLDAFVHTWKRFDPGCTLVMPTADVPKLIVELEPPLGIRSDHYSAMKLLMMIRDLKIPVREDEKGACKVRYLDTFLALVRRAQHGLEDEPDDDMFESSASEEEESDTDEYAQENEASFSLKGRSKHNTSPQRSPQRKHKHRQTAVAAALQSIEAKAHAPSRLKDEWPQNLGKRPTIAHDYAARILQGSYKEYMEAKLQVKKLRYVQKVIPLKLGHLLRSSRASTAGSPRGNGRSRRVSPREQYAAFSGSFNSGI